MSDIIKQVGSMRFKILALCLFFVITNFLSLDAVAQSGSTFGPRRQIATIIFAGLGGAVLGLSTLSFYGEPQEHISNISTGFALGIIAGTAVVTFQATQNPVDAAMFGPSAFDQQFKVSMSRKAPPLLSYGWEF